MGAALPRNDTLSGVVAARAWGGAEAVHLVTPLVPCGGAADRAASSEERLPPPRQPPLPVLPLPQQRFHRPCRPFRRSLRLCTRWRPATDGLRPTRWGRLHCRRRQCCPLRQLGRPGFYRRRICCCGRHRRRCCGRGRCLRGRGGRVRLVERPPVDACALAPTNVQEPPVAAAAVTEETAAAAAAMRLPSARRSTPPPPLRPPWPPPLATHSVR